MPLNNSSATVYGGAGGRGAKASVSSPEGLRNMLRKNNTDRDSAPVPPPKAAPSTSSAPPPAVPEDDKQTLKGLNDRLQNYVNRVSQLKEENGELQKEIDDILAKRKAPEKRDWDEVQKPLDELEKKIKDLTLDNAKLLLQNDNARLANEDFKNKLVDEVKARKELEKDLDQLKNVIDDIRLQRDQVKTEVKLVKNEIDHLKKDHDDVVEDLLKKIRDSEVTVEIESKNTNLADTINKIRVQYQKMAEKNLKEMDDWYNDKFENIKVEEAQNIEACQTANVELKELQRQKKELKVQIETMHNILYSLEDSVRRVSEENSKRLNPLYRMMVNLETELKEVRAQMEHQGEKNNQLLLVKMKLEKEINKYKELMLALSGDNERPQPV